MLVNIGNAKLRNHNLSSAYAQFLPQVRLELTRHHTGDAARHENMSIGFNLDFNLSAGAMHREFTVHMPQLVCRACRGATAAPRRQRVSRAPLPNLNPDVAAIDDLQQLDVDFVRK